MDVINQLLALPAFLVLVVAFLVIAAFVPDIVLALAVIALGVSFVYGLMRQ